MPGFKVAIIGAGPAGCLLARLLHLNDIEVVVFERDSSPDFRSQGGTLDLHTSTGLAALKEAGLFDEFLKHARYDGQYLALVDKDLNYFVKKDAKGAFSKLEERPEIDRSELRLLLATSLPDGMIRWGHRLASIGEDKTLAFDHTTESGFDLIVGADGVWSKVRAFLKPDLVPQFSGVGMYELEITDAEKIAPNVYKLVNRGSVFASSEGHRYSIQQMGDGSLSMYAAWVTDSSDWMSPEKCSFDAQNPAEAKKHLLEHEFRDWCPELKEGLEKANGKCTPRSLFYLPPGAKWDHKPGFTLIGDAAHAMTSHAGEGVNQAMDGVMILNKVIKEVVQGKIDLDEGLVQYQKDMFARVTGVQQLSLSLTQDWMFTPGAPKSVMPKVISRHVKHAVPWFLRPVAVAMVYSYFYGKDLLGV